MKRLTSLVFFCFFIAACGGSTVSNDGDTGHSGDTANSGNTAGDTADSADSVGDSGNTGNSTTDTADTGNTTDSGNTADAGDSADTGNTASPVAYCAIPCTTAADCVVNPSAATPILDADNYACNDGWCTYTGCNSDDECASAINPNYGCLKDVAVPSCVKKCSSSADCASPGITDGAYSENNYECSDGYCVYTGCNSNEECEQTMASTGKSYECDSVDGVDIDMCVLRCQTAADCTHPGDLYDESHFSCDNHRCVFLGCRSDKECQDALYSEQYRCKK